MKVNWFNFRADKKDFAEKLTDNTKQSSPKHDALILGYDFGTSAVKAVLVNLNGEVLRTASAVYPLQLPAPGHAEQNPMDWWAAMGAVTHELFADSAPLRERVAGLGIAAQMAGTIPVDASGEPLHPCLTWMDTRSAAVAHAITKGGIRVAGYGITRLLPWLWTTNGAPNLAGKDPLSKILWFRSARPDIWQAAARFLDVKDWLIHRLTGKFTTTPDVAQLTWLMDNRIGQRAWSQMWLDRMGIERGRLPDIVESGAVAGGLTPAAAQALGLPPGLTVAGGCGDINACALAAGDHDDGAYHLHLGTSLWLGAHSARRHVDPLSGTATLCAAAPDRFFLVATQETAGAAASWAAAALGFGEGKPGLKAMDEAAAQVAPTAEAPLFLPWLHGERVPINDPNLRGALVGVTLRTSRGELARSILEGVALNARWALDKASRMVPLKDAPIRMMGGGAGSEIWMQVFADTLQRPLLVLDSPAYSGACGAAMTASLACGAQLHFATSPGLVSKGRLIEPQRSLSALVEHRYRYFMGYGANHRRNDKKGLFHD
jgi:xylulokinase